jgi:hypothetical protein
VQGLDARTRCGMPWRRRWAHNVVAPCSYSAWATSLARRARWSRPESFVLAVSYEAVRARSSSRLHVVRPRGDLDAVASCAPAQIGATRRSVRDDPELEGHARARVVAWARKESLPPLRSRRCARACAFVRESARILRCVIGGDASLLTGVNLVLREPDLQRPAVPCRGGQTAW